MSTAMMTAAFRRSKSKGNARLVLLAIADEANDEGLCTAYRRSQSWLAKKANCDVDTVRRAIETLAALGEVEVLARGDGRKSSDYRLTIDENEQPPQNTAPQPETPAPAPRGASPRKIRPQPPQDAGAIIPFFPVDNPVTTTTAAAPPNSERDPIGEYAQQLTVRAFEMPTKPVVRGDGSSAFVAVRQIVERLLRAGTPVGALREAIEGEFVTVWTIAGIQTAVAQARGRPKQNAGERRMAKAAAAVGLDPAGVKADSDAFIATMFDHGKSGDRPLNSDRVIDTTAKGDQ